MPKYRHRKKARKDKQNGVWKHWKQIQEERQGEKNGEWKRICQDKPLPEMSNENDTYAYSR
jgi:hypothetical protein